MGDDMQPINLTPPPFSAEIPQGRIGPSSLPTGPLPAGTHDRSEDSLGALEETTLDEPVVQTILRDVKMVTDKMKKVILLSADTRDELRNWDLWGPLILCLTLAILLSIDESGHPAGLHNQDDRPAVVFSALLVVVWVGAVVVTINAKLLGGNVSFFQNICLLGYCVAPMIAATAACMFIHLALPDSTFTCGPGPFTSCESDDRCVDTANISVNVGASCKGWNDKSSCFGDGLCNSVHTNYGNVILRLSSSLGGLFWSLRSSLAFLSEVVKPERRALAAYPVCLFFGAIAWMVMLRTSSS